MGCDGNNAHDEAHPDQTNGQDPQLAPMGQRTHSPTTLKPAARSPQAGIDPPEDTTVPLPKFQRSVSSALDLPAPEAIIPQAGPDWLEFPDWGVTSEPDDEPDFCGSDEQSSHLHSAKSHAAEDITPHSPQPATAEAASPMVEASQACMPHAAKARIKHTASGNLQNKECLFASAAAPETAHHQHPKNVQHLEVAAYEPVIVNASRGDTVASSGLQQDSQQLFRQQPRPMEDTAHDAPSSLTLEPGVVYRVSSNIVQGEAAEEACQQLTVPCQHASDDILPGYEAGHLHDPAFATSTPSLRHSLLAVKDTPAMSTRKLPVKRKQAYVPLLNPLHMDTGQPHDPHAARTIEEADMVDSPLQQEVWLLYHHAHKVILTPGQEAAIRLFAGSSQCGRPPNHMCLQNLFLALASIAALALPMLMGRIPLWMAVMGHEGSTLLVALNCLRLLRAPTGFPANPSGAFGNPLGDPGSTSAPLLREGECCCFIWLC